MDANKQKQHQHQQPANLLKIWQIQIRYGFAAMWWNKMTWTEVNAYNLQTKTISINDVTYSLNGQLIVCQSILIVCIINPVITLHNATHFILSKRWATKPNESQPSSQFCNLISINYFWERRKKTRPTKKLD